MKSALSSLGRRTEAPPISWLMNLALSRPNLISLAAGFTDNESLPVDLTRDLVNEILRHAKRGQPALQYGPTPGDPELRQLTADRVLHLDQASGGRIAKRRYDVDRTIITNGSQQLLYMLTEALFDPGDIALVEDPTYFVYLGIAQSHGLRCRGIRMQPDGIDLEHLEFCLQELKKSGDIKRLKMLYLVAYHQNPACLTTSLAKKRAALALLAKYEKSAGHPIYLLEDSAYRELCFTGEDPPAALTLKGAEDRVIYTGTYSKPFATGVRAGFGILPEDLFTIVTRIKGNHDFGTANVVQHVLTRALKSGKYEKHLAQIQHRYAAKAEVMLTEMRRHFPDAVTWPDTRGGLYYWGVLPQHAKTGLKSKIFNAALDAGVFYVPGSLCYADDSTRRKPDHELRISFGAASLKNIRKGIRLLGQVLHENL